jgi:hypothetical protein
MMKKLLVFVVMAFAILGFSGIVIAEGINDPTDHQKITGDVNWTSARGVENLRTVFSVHLDAPGKNPIRGTVTHYNPDGVCNSEKGENWQNCPADCEKPSDNGDDDDEDDEGLDECCCCTSQGFVEYGKPFEEKKIIVSGNVIEDEPIVLNQRFKENKVNLGIWSIISIVLLILLIAMLVIWILEKR